MEVKSAFLSQQTTRGLKILILDTQIDSPMDTVHFVALSYPIRNELIF
jgi:hypothetical protein